MFAKHVRRTCSWKIFGEHRRSCLMSLDFECIGPTLGIPTAQCDIICPHTSAWIGICLCVFISVGIIDLEGKQTLVRTSTEDTTVAISGTAALLQCTTKSTRKQIAAHSLDTWRQLAAHSLDTEFRKMNKCSYYFGSDAL